MPTYKVTDPQTGRTLKLTGDSPPTEAELHDVFSQFKDAPNSAPRQAAGPIEALITNLPAKGFVQNLVRGLPATAGGMAGAASGAAMGAPFGPVGMVVGGVLGAGLGGGAGEAGRQAVAQGTAAAFPEANYPVATPKQVLGNVGIQAATQAAGEAGGQLIGAGLKAIRPALNTAGAQVMRVGAGIPEKQGLAAMRNPSVLLDAPSPEVASEGYKAFERYTGLKGLGDSVAQAGRFPSEGELEKQLFEVAARAKNGVPSTAQELYHASQAASSLNQLGKLGNPRYAMLQRAISDAKSVVDDSLEAMLPEYKNLRADYAASKVADAFSSVLPLNKNQSPNVLRSALAGREAIAGGVALAGIGTGNPIGLAALPLISPKFYGTALKGAALAGKVPAGVYRVGAQALTGTAGSAIEDAYMSQRRIPIPDPAFQSMGGVRPAIP